MANGRRRGGAERLGEFFGDPVPPEELSMWTAMSVDHRGKAIQRMQALKKWMDGEGTIDVATAAADAGVKSVNRMYEMRKAWIERRSLASLGAFAGAPKTRVAKYDASVRKVLTAVVDADPAASVRKLALDLEAAIGIPAEDRPSHNTLRRYVEEERRRRNKRASAGNDLRLDCSGCTLTPSDPTISTLFVIMDRSTHIVLGAALGEFADSLPGYARAAADALRRIAAGEFSDLCWVEAMQNAEIVVGDDGDRWSRFFDRVGDIRGKANVQPSTRKNRFGGYLRELAGLRIGTVVVLPLRTPALKGAGAGIRDAGKASDRTARLAAEVDDYNAAIVLSLKPATGLHPPDNMMRMLEMLAASSPSR